MKKTICISVLLTLTLAAVATAQQSKSQDYFEANRAVIQNGVQAVLMCNGLFTSQRTLDQVFEQELAYLEQPIGTAQGGAYRIDTEIKMVAVGLREPHATVRAAFRPGLGCIVMPPDQSSEDVADLPSLNLPYPPTNPEQTAWPDGDVIESSPLASAIDPAALQAASDWTFTRKTPEQVSLSLLIVHKGKIIHERYASGVNSTTKTRTWSTAKSIAVTLIGMLVDEGKMALDSALDIEWLPPLSSPETDPRQHITLRHVLNMSSGLYPVDSFGKEYATGSGLAYWAGASSTDRMRDRGLVREPGTFWDYENYDTLLAVYAMKQALGNEQAYSTFPRRALFDKIGMRSTLASTDRFGDFILSSQVYSNARDLARFGLLYLNGGKWNGEQLISQAWIDFVRSPAPATRKTGNFYGGQWWLVPEGRTDVPADAYSTAGNRGQYVIVVPSHDLVIVRRGLDYGKQGFSNWDLTREVLKAFPG